MNSNYGQKDDPVAFRLHSERSSLGGRAGLALLCLIAATFRSTADDTNVVDVNQDRLKQLSLEELMNIEVTSVAKKSEKLSQSPAAIYVITQEDIRRSGVTSIPEALRLAPGMEVAQVDAHTWAISARGFNSVFANKLLVLIDGRSVYTPLFSGVFWDVQDVMIEDIDRIEVIRGPGATLWGANAVNGVINIITRSAEDTQGALVSAGGGSQEQGFGAARYGGRIGTNAFFRIYGKYFNRAPLDNRNGNATEDGWATGRGGFRLDWTPSPENLLTLQGDAYNGSEEQRFTVPILTPPFSATQRGDSDFHGGNVLGRWTHRLSERSDVTLQTYYDRTDRDMEIGRETRNTFDVDTQHRFLIAERNEIVWGFGYRLSSDRIENSATVHFDPRNRTTHLFSVFVQDEITIVPERLRLTLGSKFEHNDFTGFEIQPSGRILWTPNPRNTAWASVSRAVRTPSRAEDDVRIDLSALPPDALFPGSPPAFTSVFGNHGFESEELIAYELGYRLQPHERLWVDVATFYNVYDRLVSAEPGAPFFEASPAPPHLVVPISFDNKLSGETYGVEAAANWQMLAWWRWKATYTFLDMQLHSDKGSADTSTEQGNEGSSPEHRFSLRCSLDLPHNLELDWVLRAVDRLPSQNVSAYVTLDLRLGWRPTRNLEFSVIGQNLLDNQHPEFGPSPLGTPASEVPRSVYGKVTWQF